MSVDRSWVWSVLMGLGFGLLLLLASVWLSIERTNLGYDIEKLERDIQVVTKFIDKLEVERDNRLSPYSLDRLAKKYGLGPATPGQIRRMTGTTQSIPPGNIGNEQTIQDAKQ